MENGAAGEIGNPKRKSGLAGPLARGLGAFLSVLSLASCLFETKAVDPKQPGYLLLDVSLQPASSALFKTASADTLFRLDSLILILSAPGADTLRNAYAISGRADSAAIAFAPKAFALAPLRTWKAKILSIDTTLKPARRDTVHLDSVAFQVLPGDTVSVSKTANPAYSILRTRLVSKSAASLANNVKYLRLRVDGITRDSAAVGPNLRAVEFGNATDGWAVGDSGTILKTSNKGTNWTAQASGTVRNLYGLNFPGASAGWAVGEGGTVLKTTNGTVWASVASGTAMTLNAAWFSSGGNGWVVGNSGTILLTANGTSFSAQSSGTTRNLKGVCFTNASRGSVVGEGGTILRTTDGGATWSAQTSGTAKNLNGVYWPSSTTGFAVGDSGVILKTTNSGTTWAALASGTTANLLHVAFTSTSSGTISGEDGTLLATANGTVWTARASGTDQDLHGIAWTTNASGAVAVGLSGTFSVSATGTAWTLQLIGAKLFDLHLTYKYFKPNVTHTLLMEAIDTLSGTLRGYQASKTVLLSPGKDSTVAPDVGLSKCGYGGVTPACTP
jgi:photosystem II stability/assembly factor-like uncharacterized protein